jgi:hypothetical protein
VVVAHGDEDDINLRPDEKKACPIIDASISFLATED